MGGLIKEGSGTGGVRATTAMHAGICFGSWRPSREDLL